MSARLVILASGSGSLAQAIFDAQRSGELEVEIVALICDQPKALVVERAKVSGIDTFLNPISSNRAAWDAEIYTLTKSLNPDLVVSAGFMRILSAEFVKDFKTINAHPALLPLFPGAHAVRDALQAGVEITGATIHWVDAGVDTGEVIAQSAVEINSDDNESSLHERIKMVERELIVKCIRELLPTLEKNVDAR